MIIALNSLLGSLPVSTLLSLSKILPCSFILNLFPSCLILLISPLAYFSVFVYVSYVGQLHVLILEI